jgi:hypothetical protein
MTNVLILQPWSLFMAIQWQFILKIISPKLTQDGSGNGRELFWMSSTIPIKMEKALAIM